MADVFPSAANGGIYFCRPLYVQNKLLTTGLSHSYLLTKQGSDEVLSRELGSEGQVKRFQILMLQGRDGQQQARAARAHGCRESVGSYNIASSDQERFRPQG